MLEFRARTAADPGAVAALCAMGRPERTAQLMVLRGIADEGAARAYLHPTLDDLHDPFLLRGMREAVTASGGPRRKSSASASTATTTPTA